MLKSHTLCATLALSLFGTFAHAADAKRQVLLIAGKPSHGPGQHEHNAGVQLLAKCLKENAADKVDVQFVLNGQWPEEAVLKKADSIVIYSDGGTGHPALPHLAELAAQMQRGCGFVCLHYAVEPAFNKVGWPEPEIGADGKPLKQTPPPDRSSNGAGSPEFLQWLGGYFEQFWSVNPHWDANFKELPKHPISNGVNPFSTNDEWYYHMRFRPDMKGVTPILTALPPKDTLSRPDGTHSGNPAVREAIAKGEPQHMMWVSDNADGSRGFGFTGAHFHKNWQNNDFRKLVLNAITWVSKAEIPADGVPVKDLSQADLDANLDKK